MKTLIIAAAVGMIGISTQASAACNGNNLNQNQLGTLLTGNTVCVPAVTTNPMTWQELHQSGGALTDYKRGPNDSMDPSKTVGTWSITGTGTNARVVHAYNGGGGTYTYAVQDNGDGTHSFCSTAPEIVARVKTGGGAC